MTTLTLSREEFAARRRTVLDDAVAELIPSVRKGLADYPADGWKEPILEGAEQVFRRSFHEESDVDSPNLDDAVQAFRESIDAALDHQSEPIGSTVDLVATWLATAAVNGGVTLAAQTDLDTTSREWVSMEDSHVRDTHVAADGQTVGVFSDFTVGGVDTPYPGAPVGPIELWINCRCVVRLGDVLPAAARTEGMAMANAVTEVEPDEADILAEMEDMDPDDFIGEPIPWHGQLVPEGVMSGDRRMFSKDALTWRDLPLPLAWQPTNEDGHKGSVVVGRIDGIYRTDNVLHGYGVWDTSPAAGEALRQVLEGFARGVSVDVDDVVLALDEENDTSEITQGRICGATIVSIPAFMEAGIQLGYDPSMGEDGEEFRTVSPEQRKKAADRGAALPDGSFPIENVDDLKNAIQAIGRAKDPAKAKAHIKKRAKALGHPELIPDTWAAETFAPGLEDGPGWVTHPKATSRIIEYWAHGRGAAKIRWNTPGDFKRCESHLGKYVPQRYLAGLCANLHKRAIGVWPGQEGPGRKGNRGHHSLIEDDCTDCGPALILASAATTARRAVFFTDPKLTEPTPLTITPDGHVYGHAAIFGECHIGIGNTCVVPPRSTSDYAYFRKGITELDDGSQAWTGVLSMGGGHADRFSGYAPAVAHYDSTSAAIADVITGEDEIGIWFSGQIRPGASDEQVDTLRAAGSVSGDWRPIRGGLEFVALLVVNTPGFPVPRVEAATAGGRQVSLVAAGMVISPVDDIVERVVERFDQRVRQQRLAALRTAENRRRMLALVTD